jgi:Ca2+-binding EF-hand superfamily protein
VKNRFQSLPFKLNLQRRYAALSISKLNNADNIARAFSYFDKDGSGYITVGGAVHVDSP